MIKTALKRIAANLSLGWLKFKYRNRPYSEMYAEIMDKKAKSDPQLAVGGRWEEMGMLQINYLRMEGLKPENTILDFGCGSLRAGIRFIEYLNTGNYAGVDISTEIINQAHVILKEAKLEAKNPTLMVSHDLTFDYLSNRKFDFMLATSVFTHMLWTDIEIVLSNIHKIMGPNSTFYATFLDKSGDRETTIDYQNFYYVLSDFEAVAKKYNLVVEKKENFVHPRDQKMLAFRLKSVGK